ncbi:MAG: DUF3006 domain-containing protein [Clostridia bacterium]
MQGIVDRIENNFAVIEVEDKMYNVDIKDNNEALKEGDVVDIILEDGKIVKIKKNYFETASRKEYIKEITKDMWQ